MAQLALGAPAAGDDTKGAKKQHQIPPWLADEWKHPAKREANLKLLRALAVFAAGVLVARNFGEALFVA
jgi:hypothetical protein